MLGISRRLSALLAFFSLAGAAAAPVSASLPPLPASQKRAIEAAARKELAAYGAAEPVPGVFIAVYVPGHAAYVKSVGYANLAAKQPFRLGDKFRIGSNTKTFVVTVLLQLVDEHRLRLDDTISTFNLGLNIPNADTITVRQLCEMRSGLFEAYNTPQLARQNVTPQSRFTPRQLVRWASAHKPLFAPGARYDYSNTNYLILGLIIEKITRDTVGNQISRRILRPMALTDTSFPDTPAMPLPYSHGYDAQGKTPWQDVTVDVPPSLTWAAGAMISTVPDMKRWVKSYVLGTMNGKTSQRARLRCLPTGTGRGLKFGLGIGCSAGWYGYTGGLPGYNTAAYYLPSKDVTVIAFVNAQRERPIPGVANSIFRDITRIVTPANVPY